MTTASVYIGLVVGGSADDMADSYPADGNINSNLSNGLTVGTSSNSSAMIELRYDTTNNVTVTHLNTMNLIEALEHFRRFLLQRGFIGGSGGPSGNAPTDTQPAAANPV